MIRKPQASEFYPQNEKELTSLLDKLFDSVEGKGKYRHGIVPHAGMIYSGFAAASLYKYLKKAKTVVILGNDHYGNAFEISSHPYEAWETPLGKVPVAQDIVEKLGVPLVESRKEHSIEIQLPFLQHAWGEFSIVPITVPQAPLSALEQLGSQLKELNLPIVATTDFSHYVPKEVAVHKDSLAIEQILKGNERELVWVVEREKISMCGLHPVLAWMFATQDFEKELLLYYTSGDIIGDEDSVVGYGAIGGKDA